jgi:hypothetical protein
MDRTLSPVVLVIRRLVEEDLERRGFHLASEQLHYDAFGSAQFEYCRRGARLRLIWDGKDHWAWISLAPQPTGAFPHPDAYHDIDGSTGKSTSVVPFLTTTEQGRVRAHELLRNLEGALQLVPQDRQL